MSIRFRLLPEQKRIVAILDEAFEGIATAAANAEKNLANARELFESYLNSVFAQQDESGWTSNSATFARSIMARIQRSKSSKWRQVDFRDMKGVSDQHASDQVLETTRKSDGELSKPATRRQGDVLSQINGNLLADWPHASVTNADGHSEGPVLLGTLIESARST